MEAIQGYVAQDVEISFGKHKGKQAKHVDDGYLHWMQATFKSSCWEKVAFQALEQRKWILLDELKLTRNMQRGKKIHEEAVESGHVSCVYMATALIKMYAKFKSMADARRVFDTLTRPGVLSWTALILGYADNGEGIVALDLFQRMKSEGFVPDSVTFVAALKACTSLAVDPNGRAECLEWGRGIHSQIGYHSNAKVQSTLINMYAKCGNMVEARKVFEDMKKPDLVSWTTLILGYADNGEGIMALDIFAKMKSQGCTPDSVTFVAALKACISLTVDEIGRAECLERGKEIHSQIGRHLDSKVPSTLINMYAKCGSMTEAAKVFECLKHPDLVSLNNLLLGYVDNGEGVKALDLFARMQAEGCAPDSITFVAALKACTFIQDGSGLKRGKELHLQIGIHSNMKVQSTLIYMYAKFGSMFDARQVFESMKNPDVVSWNALIMGYAENGDGVNALDLFAKMKTRGCSPQSITFAAALKASGLVGALECGTRIHADLKNNGTEPHEILLTCLVDFYAKCGDLVSAQGVFDSFPVQRDLATWNALLAGYSRLGDDQSVFKLFEGLQDAGLQPNDITFLCFLMCCSHAGLVDRGTECLKNMSMKYGVAPSLEHYTCVVDILGRSNKLDDAMALLKSMPCKPDSVIWTTALSSCRKWKNVHVGSLIFKSLIDLDKTNSGAYVLMAQIYGSKGMWKEREMVLLMKNELKVLKQQGKACWTNENGQVHTFLHI